MPALYGLAFAAERTGRCRRCASALEKNGGLVGQTGSAKSTLTHLVNRTYDPDAGRIAIDGVDLRDWNLTSLRSQIATVEQDVFSSLHNARNAKVPLYALSGTPEVWILDLEADRIEAYADPDAGYHRSMRRYVPGIL